VTQNSSHKSKVVKAASQKKRKRTASRKALGAPPATNCIHCGAAAASASFFAGDKEGRKHRLSLDMPPAGTPELSPGSQQQRSGAGGHSTSAGATSSARKAGSTIRLLQAEQQGREGVCLS